MPSESLKGQIGGLPPLLSAIKITDPDTADTGLLGTNKITFSTSSGKFSILIPTSVVTTEYTFDHDLDDTTNPLEVKSITEDGQTLYFYESESSIAFLSPVNNNPESGFDLSNLGISGIGSTFLEITGALDFIQEALTLTSLKGEEAGTAVITVQAEDSTGASSERKNLNVDLTEAGEAAIADGDYILFLDCDEIPTPNFLDFMENIDESVNLWSLRFINLYEDEKHYRVDNFVTRSGVPINWNPFRGSGWRKWALMKYDSSQKYDYDITCERGPVGKLHPAPGNTLYPHKETEDFYIIHYGKIGNDKFF